MKGEGKERHELPKLELKFRCEHDMMTRYPFSLCEFRITKHIRNKHPDYQENVITNISHDDADQALLSL